MLYSQRILRKNNTVEEDLSVSLSSFRSGTVTFDYVAAEDYLYIASNLPFNHKWFYVSGANAEASVVSVDIWDGDSWNAAVDVIDNTSTGGKSLAQSGIIRWTTDKDEGWAQEEDSEDVTGVTAIGLYNMYWARLSWSADLTNTTELTFVGNKFSNDDILESYYPDLANDSLKGSFETGKTDWEEQHYMAAKRVVKDLTARRIILSSSQILDFEKFEEPATHKVAEIVYWGLGKAYNDNRKTARDYYNESMNQSFFNVDLDRDANLSEVEQTVSISYMKR